MRFLSFFSVFILVTFIVSIKLLVSNQEKKIKNLKKNSIFLENKIQKLNIDISYSTRPQNLKQINDIEFQMSPIIQNEIIKIDKQKF